MLKESKLYRALCKVLAWQGVWSSVILKENEKHFTHYHLFWHPGLHRALHYDPLQKEEEGMATQVIIVI